MGAALPGYQPMTPLPPETIEALRAHYRAGTRASHVARAVEIRRKVSESTVSRWFAMFAAEGEVRGQLAPSRVRQRMVYEAYGTPIYDGPAMIGTAITEPTPPVGPGWIGKAAVTIST